VAELRKILGPSFLLTRRGGYALSAQSDCWIDAEEFSHLEELGRRAYRQENYDEAIRRLQEAVALYRGEYLAEDRYEEWGLAEARALSGALRGGLESACGLSGAAGAVRKSVGVSGAGHRRSPSAGDALSPADGLCVLCGGAGAGFGGV
jgi:hypothetical protein